LILDTGANGVIGNPLDCGIPLPFLNIDNQRSLLYLGNLVDAIVACCTCPNAQGETFLVSDGENVSTTEL
jgi:hypothetical protein